MVTTTTAAAGVGAGGPPLPLAALLVLLLPPPRAAEGAAGLAESVVWAVNAGGEAHVDVHGIHFRKDPLEGRVGRGSCPARLFEMGFAEQLQEILARLPKNGQTVLFSATRPKLLVEFAHIGLPQRFHGTPICSSRGGPGQLPDENALQLHPLLQLWPMQRCAPNLQDLLPHLQPLFQRLVEIDLLPHLQPLFQRLVEIL